MKKGSIKKSIASVMSAVMVLGSMMATDTTVFAAEYPEEMEKVQEKVSDSVETATEETEETVCEETTNEETANMETSDQETETSVETSETETQEELQESEQKISVQSEESEVVWQNVAISSISYEMQITGVTEETELKFQGTTTSWENIGATVTVASDGVYTFSVSPTWSETVDGLFNPGYFDVIENSNIEATLISVTINDTIVLPASEDQTLYIGLENGNGFKNIWSNAPGYVLASNETYQFRIESDNSKIVLVEAKKEEDIPQVTESIKTINTMTYKFTVSGVTEPTDLTLINQAVDWTTFTTPFRVEENGEVEVTVSVGKDGLCNLGYIENIQDSTIEVTWTGLKINDTYDFTLEEAAVAKVGSEYENGFYNIWNTANGFVVAATEGAYVAYKNSSDGFALYVEKNMSSTGMKTSRSQDYVEAMGQGWNLGNQFEVFDSSLPEGTFVDETAWGNPVVTKELILAVKEKGYDTIRMPFTAYGRWEVDKEGSEYKYTILPEWLARYKEVVDYATSEGMHVVINLHCDHVIWLDDWDGDVESEEYLRFCELWEQLAQYFADESDLVSFETINEPDFRATSINSAQEKLDLINKAAYDVIRKISGNENRMIIMPTMNTNDEKGQPLYSFICELQDENIIATVHYYSAWVYSANLGITGFDEQLWQQDGYDCYSARAAAKEAFQRVYDQFCAHGIGVVVGEWGLLGYDAGEECNQPGEELKYYEYISELGREYNMALLFWDNGSGINRKNGVYDWKKPLVGKMLESCNNGERSSYATGLDTLYFEKEATKDVRIPLTLNGNIFTGIEGLTEGVEYTYDAASDTVILTKEYVNACFKNAKDTGCFETITMKFSSGCDWMEYLVKTDAPVYKTSQGTTTDGFFLSVDFKGNKVRRMTTYAGSDTNGQRIGANSSWWSYLQFDGTYTADYEKGAIVFKPNYFQDETVANVTGDITAVIEYYDGHIDKITFQKEEEKVSYQAVEKKYETVRICIMKDNDGTYDLVKCKYYSVEKETTFAIDSFDISKEYSAENGFTYDGLYRQGDYAKYKQGNRQPALTMDPVIYGYTTYYVVVKDRQVDENGEVIKTVIYTDGVKESICFKDQVYAYTELSDLPAFEGTPSRSGYRFAGWNEPVVSEDGNVVITAKWTKLVPVVVYVYNTQNKTTKSVYLTNAMNLEKNDSIYYKDVISAYEKVTGIQQDKFYLNGQWNVLKKNGFEESKAKAFSYSINASDYNVLYCVE